MAVTELREATVCGNPKSDTPPLSELKINGITPFGSHRDDLNDRLAEAHAILTLLQGAHYVCEEADDAVADAFHSIRHEIKARALLGVGTLIALARHHLDCADAAHKQAEVRHGHR